MNSYWSTFVVGFEEVVKERLSKDLVGFNVKHLSGGIVVFETTTEIEKIKQLPYLNNSFLLLQVFKFSPENIGLTSMIEKIEFESLPNVHLKHKTFRFVFSSQNQLKVIPKILLAKIEGKISSRFGLAVDRTNPDIEFWFLIRNDGQGFFGQRLTSHPDWKCVLAKGQLRPELAALLWIVSDVKTDDIVLDPFSGSGAIEMAGKYFPHKQFISGDINPTGKDIRKLDATKMLETKSGSINKIITDPPWGVSVGKELDLLKFYDSVLKEFVRVLKPGGQIVVLIGNKPNFEKVLENFIDSLKLVKKYDILVSGKMAAVYKILRV